MNRGTFRWGWGVLTNLPTIATNNRVNEENVANSLGEWPTLNSVLAISNVLGCDPPTAPKKHITGEVFWKVQKPDSIGKLRRFDFV